MQAAPKRSSAVAESLTNVQHAGVDEVRLARQAGGESGRRRDFQVRIATP